MRSPFFFGLEGDVEDVAAVSVLAAYELEAVGGLRL